MRWLIAWKVTNALSFVEDLIRALTSLPIAMVFALFNYGDTKCPEFISANPTPAPTNAPTVSPTREPTDEPSVSPTVAPSQPTSSPTSAPTKAPTSAPSMSPVDSSDSDSESGSDSDSDEIAMALFSAQRTDENVDEYAGAKQYHLTVGLSSTSWMQLWAIFAALMILNVICFFMYCRKKAN